MDLRHTLFQMKMIFIEKGLLCSDNTIYNFITRRSFVSDFSNLCSDFNMYIAYENLMNMSSGKCRFLVQQEFRRSALLFN